MPSASHVPFMHLVVVSMVVCVGSAPWMMYGHLRPTQPPPVYLPFCCNNQGRWVSQALPVPSECTHPMTCIPPANSIRPVDCCLFFDIVIQYLPPSSANFAIQNACNFGRVGQINDSSPSSLGATRSFDPSDCFVVGPWCWRVPLDELCPSKAAEAHNFPTNIGGAGR